MKTRYFLFLLLFLVTFGACSDPNHITEPLHRAEALMNEDPDSAWAVLSTISPDEMGKNRNRALYALLYTQAQDKTYRDETNDSLISIAVDYYRDTDDARHKFLSFYYKGRVHFNAKDYQNATLCYMEAEQLAGEVGDDYLAGLLYAELGRIYRLYFDYPKSLEAYQKAAEYYERAGKIRHRNYMWLNQSDICRNMNDYNEGELLLQKVLVSGKEEKDSALIRLSIGTLLMQYIENEKMQKADSLYRELKNFIGKDFGSSSYLGRLAQMNLSLGNYAQAELLIDEGWKKSSNQLDSIKLYVASAELYSLQGKGERAYRELQKGMIIQNQEAQQALEQPVLTAQRNFLSEKLALETYHLQLEKRLKLLSIFLGVLLILIVCYVFRKIIKKRHEEALCVIQVLEKQKEETEKQREQAEKDKEQLEKENQKILSLLQKMDRDKNFSNQTIQDLKIEISKYEKENYNAIQTIQELNGTVTEKEENCQTMMSLVQKLEDENKVNVETIIRLRESLETKERVYQKYVQNTEKLRTDLQNEIEIKSGHISALLKDKFGFMGEWILLYEEELTLKNFREKKIKQAVDDTRMRYFKGKNVFRDLEMQVNLYCDNAMLYFREEVLLNDEKDYFRVCCLFAGIPPHIIAWMMNEKTDVVYQRKSRLRKKIASLPCLHQLLFLRLLPK